MIITNRDGTVKQHVFNIQLSKEKEFEKYPNILAMSSDSSVSRRSGM